MAAVVTLLEMAAENSSPTDLNRGHGAALRRGERSAVFVEKPFAAKPTRAKELSMTLLRRRMTEDMHACRSE